MDTYSKMDGSAPVSSALDGVWNIQKRGVIKDQENRKGKKDGDKKEEEKTFEDGLVLKEGEMKKEAQEEPEQDKVQPTEENPPTERKIDIII
jgi:hypothetical protein